MARASGPRLVERGGTVYAIGVSRSGARGATHPPTHGTGELADNRPRDADLAGPRPTAAAAEAPRHGTGQP